MIDTQVFTQDRSGKYEPLFKTKEIQARVVDGVLTVTFLAVFVGLLFLLAK